ncbi:MAG: hemerythrin domain-containing protein [Thaumarchaeota archaeon]|nr:hemerythrin domain-containing protein [Nitrososphaerota archaeon]MCY3975896.1 hemerythrin domain-containing protein [Nitrososphaerota archaeon]
MNATDVLKKDHVEIRRFEKIIAKCSLLLYKKNNVPIKDLEKISFIISEFLDAIHYTREENSYFACVSSYDILQKEIRTFLIEHEFSRRISQKIMLYLQSMKNGNDEKEKLARFLKTYSIYLNDHLAKESKFFDHAQKVLSVEEEAAMLEQFQSFVLITTKINEIIKQIGYLENQSWYKNNS